MRSRWTSSSSRCKQLATVPLVGERPGIRLAGPWGAHSQSVMTEWARHASAPLATRLLFAALGRHNRNNHASFMRGELAELLGEIDFVTGEVVPVRSDSLTKALRKAKG